MIALMKKKEVDICSPLTRHCGDILGPSLKGKSIGSGHIITMITMGVGAMMDPTHAL